MAINKQKIELASWIFKMYILYQLKIIFGYFISLILLLIILKIKSLILEFLFNLTSLEAVDIGFLSDEKSDRFNLMSIIKLDSFNPEEMKQIIIKKALNSIPKLRSKIVWKFLNYYWEQVDIKESISRIKIEKNVLENEQEMLKYAENFSNQYFEIEKELPWEVILVKYGENKGAFIWKCDHVMSDGLGIVSLVCSLADNYTEDIFPSIMRTKNISKSMELLYEITSYFTFFYHLPYILYSSFFFKSQHRHLKGKQKPKGVTTTAWSVKEYDISDFEAFKRVHKVSLNEILIGVISNAISRYVKENLNCTSCNKLYYFQPIGRKTLPRKIEEVSIDNDAQGIVIEVPLLKDIEKEIDKIKLTRNKISIFFARSFIIFVKIVNQFSTFNYFRSELNRGMNNIEMAISNVPGPTQTLIYGEMKSYGINCIATTGKFENFIPIISYNKKIGISYSVEKSNGVNPERMIAIIQEIIENQVISIK